MGTMERVKLSRQHLRCVLSSHMSVDAIDASQSRRRDPRRVWDARVSRRGFLVA